MEMNKTTMYEKPELDIFQIDADIDTITASNEGDGGATPLSVF